MLSLQYQIMNTILIFVLSSFLFFILKSKVATNNNKKHDPPSPPKLPLLGHLHLIGSLPHRSFYELSKKYGPIMLLKLGSIPTIVISSPAAAKAVLKDHDLACCSRPQQAASRRFSYNFIDLNLSPYGKRWRELRKLCVLELFSPKRVQSFRHIREEEVDLLLKSITQLSSSGRAPVNLTEEMLSLAANVITRIVSGKSFREIGMDKENFHPVMRRAASSLGISSASDVFPRVGWIIDRLSGVHARLETTFVELDAFFQQVVDGRIKFGATSQSNINQENIVDVLLKMGRDPSQSHFMDLTSSSDCIKALIMDIFLAGVVTTSDTIVWAMAELVRNSKLMKKLQDEIRSCVKDDRVKESDLENLQYLKLVVKEALRLHPSVPLLLPRETMSHFKLNDYSIEHKTRVYINVWAIGRDRDFWTNPEEFLPERFIGSSIDFRGQNFEFLPFGAGRRSCPGMNMGIVMVELVLANLLLCFDWKLPVGMKEEDFDMGEDSGLGVGRKSILNLVPIRCR